MDLKFHFPTDEGGEGCLQMFSLIAKDKTWPISELNWPPRYLVLVASKTNGRAGSRILGIKGSPDQADLQINAFKSDSRSNAKSSQDTEMNLIQIFNHQVIV